MARRTRDICGAVLALATGATAAHAAGILTQGGAVPPPVTASLNASLVSAAQANAIAAQSQNQLSRITTALAAMQNLQSAARSLAIAAPSTVPNGLVAGGLVPDSGLAAPGVANPVKTWTGAKTPTQVTTAGQTAVTIDQTAAQAILSWNSFNVGRATTVTFDQQGNAGWVALNQIAAGGQPAQILGAIKATGQVYLIDPNGIIFGGASQVNVGALIASSAMLGDSQFLTNGIYSPLSGATYEPSFTNAKGAIEVRAGAIIATNTPASVTQGGGNVLLLGKTVQNAGSISTPDGQTALAAGDNFLLRQGFGTTANTTSTTRGNEIAVQLTTAGSSATGGSGLVANSGVITATTGDITLVGETVKQNGVASATTSVDVRGTIHLLTAATDPFAAVTLGAGSVTLISPDLASTATALDSQRAGLIASSVTANAARRFDANAQFNDLSLLNDQQEDSRVEIVSGGTVAFAGGSQTVAQGGQVAVSAVDRIEADTNAAIDVAGTADVPLPVADNDIAVNLQNYELRDDPQNRLAGLLQNSTVYVDERDLDLVPASAADPAARDYTPGGLLEVSGYLNTTGHGIGEWTALGGAITLSTGAAGAVVTQAGSVFDIDGGSLAYQGGLLPQSYLLGGDGHVYNVNDAPAGITYAGVYDGFVAAHPHWGVDYTYADALGAPSAVYQQGYTVGRDAGSLQLATPTAVFDGTIEAGTTNGIAQTAATPAGVADPYTLGQNVVATPGTLTLADSGTSAFLPLPSDVTISAAAAPAAADLTAPVAAALVDTANFNATTLSAAGLGALYVLTNGGITVAAPLTLAPGGQLSLYGSSVDLAGNITVAGGAVTAANDITIGGTTLVLAAPTPPAGTPATGDVDLAPGAQINTAGLWTNLRVNPGLTYTQAFENGGAVSLTSVNNLTLGAGSLIDTSSGAVLRANGAAAGGAGGALSLTAGVYFGGAVPPTGMLTLDGQLRGVGYTRGGTLTLSAPSFFIADADVPAPDPAAVTLAPNFFTQGFSSYNLVSAGDVTLAPGTDVNLLEPTFQLLPAAAAVATGSPLAAALETVLLPLFTANPALTSIVQRAGASLSVVAAPALGVNAATQPAIEIGQGATVDVDPGQTISLATTGQITVDGTLSAPGGAIDVENTALPTTALADGPGQLSIFFGAQSKILATAQAVTFTNPLGAAISLAPAGGSITIGNSNTYGFGATFLASSPASVIVQSGAVIDASGSAGFDRLAVKSTLGDQAASVVAPGAIVPVVGAGGSISISSDNGLFIDGTLRAAAGGPNAAGGALFLGLDSNQQIAANGQPVLPRIFTITQTDTATPLPADLQPGMADPSLTEGTAQISADQITAGGFGKLTLFARDAFSFAGDVALTLPQQISLEDGAISDSDPTGSVVLQAPYVVLNGYVPADAAGPNGAVPIAAVTGFPTADGNGSFTVNAALIDLLNNVRFGGLLSAQGIIGVVDLPGFATENLNSTGNVRLTLSTNNGDTATPTNLVTTGDLNIAAAELYVLGNTLTGAVGNQGYLVAGYDPAAKGGVNGPFSPTGVLTITGAGTATPLAPLSVDGSLFLLAPTINQGGVIWQPLGSVSFGVLGGGSGLLGADPAATVNFLLGSLTSVSAAGLTIPFGGTTDGINYAVDGNDISANPTITGGHLAGVINGIGTGAITDGTLVTNVSPGAVLDLSGGGTLAGEGFISGEGGSTDVLVTPLLSVSASGAVSQPTLATNPVYAIVAGPQIEGAAQAVTQSGTLGSTSAVGEQIVIPAGVPGLPAGRYTLLPAQYALTPGGYRVEFDGAANLAGPAVASLTNGSYAVAGYTALANTAVQSTLPTNFTITSVATTANDADDDTETYSQFLLATAARLGAIRPTLPIDAGSLNFVLPPSAATTIDNAGTTLTAGAPGGVGSIVTFSIAGGAAALDIYGAAPPPNPPAGTVSLSAAAIDAFDPSTLDLGVPDGFGSNLDGIMLQQGAVLDAARVTITALTGGITLRPGSEIDTLGKGTVLEDSTALGPLSNGGASVLDVGNGYFNYLAAPPVEFTEYGPVTIDNGAKIFTDGTIAVSTAASVDIGVDASYGGKYIDFAIPNINIGDPGALGVTAPAGLFLSPSVLQALTAGVPSRGVPPAQILLLTASNSLNFYGTTALDLSGGNVQLVINSPAIYGYGSASDVATIAAGTIVWNGVSATDTITGDPMSATPGGVIANGAGTGAGTLDFDADTIVFGYSDLDNPVRDLTLNRTTLGFATVNLNAATAITANNQGTLTVDQTAPVAGQPGTGNLNLNTPLLTGANGATMGFAAGSAITLQSPAGTAAASGLATQTAGAEIDLTADTVDLNSAVILPSGKLDVQATGDIALGAASLLDLAGLATPIGDQIVYGFGGALVMATTAGTITQNAGSVIDVGAVDNTAGSIALTATGAGGTATLNGVLRGESTGGYASGSFNLRTNTLADFAALNDSLNAGGIFQSRAFEIAQGDLTVGDGVQAHNVDISVDSGSLTVTGTIDAAGGGAGAIDLAAGDNLTLAAGSVLDAASSVLATDAQGQPIASANAPTVNLTTTNGELTLASGATIDLASADKIARGDLELNVPRLGGVTAGDADITAGQLAITGAATIAVNAFATYNGAPDPTGTASGAPDALITQAYLDGINTNDTLPFMANAADNADLATRLAALQSAYGNDLHVRPGIDIVSATPNGDLTVSGDIDLAGYRYGPGVNPAIYGSGEPGVLNIRAGGNLNVFGSITDGFAKPIDDSGTEFANGWVLLAGPEPYTQSVVVPVAVEIAAGTKLGVGQALVNYEVPITGGDLATGAVTPVALTLTGNMKTPLAFVASSNITAGGAVLFAKGTIVPAGTKLPSGAVIAAGGSLPFAIKVGPVTWPANTPFTVTRSGSDGPIVDVAETITLLPGSYIPAGSNLVFVKGQPDLGKDGIATRPTTNGTQGQLDALAALLPQGDQSWSIGLTAGANTQGADTQAVQSAGSLAGAGDLILADTHYGISNPFNRGLTVPAFSVIRTGTGTLDLAAGGDIDEDSDFGIYTAGAQSAALLQANGTNPFNLAQGLSVKGTLLGTKNAAEAALEADYAANYPTGGGNVLVAAQGALNGFINTLNQPTVGFEQIALTDSDAIGAWLWRQGGAGQDAAWWVEFGALEPIATADSQARQIVQLDGFQGIGTLGGGNLTVQAGGNATGLNLVVADTGRVLGGKLTQTGGGNLNLTVGGAINQTESQSNLNAQATDGGGLVSDMRGSTAIDAGSIGQIIPAYGANEPNDPRDLGPLASETAQILYGLDLAPGDGTVDVATRGDLVIDRVVNPGLVQNLVNTTPVTDKAGRKPVTTTYGGTSFFSLWAATTGVTLASAGGDVTPSEGGTTPAAVQNSNIDPLDQTEYYTPNLAVAAQNGNIDFEGGTIELAPAARGQLQLLADHSILGFAQPRITQGHTELAISGANPAAQATPFDPAIAVSAAGARSFTNFSPNSQSELLTFAADSPVAPLHAADPSPALIEAGNGDIVDLQIGAVVAAGSPTVVPLVQYLAAKPFDVFAGRDIVDSGTIAAPDVFLNLASTDVTTFIAGRDILESSLDIAGPGTLLVQAGRDVYEADQGTLDSLGPIFDIDPNNRDSGAGISVLAGTGAAGPDYAAFADLFLDPASTLGLDNADAIVATNDSALDVWLHKNSHYTGTAAGAYAEFETLGAQQQDVFLRQIYFAELNASGTEFNNPASVRYKSYLLGQDAIAALFPATYAGDITLFGGSGIHTDFGGAIQALTPGGQTIIGVEGTTPPGTAGVITEGAGDIDVYAQNNVLLGESRVLTTFGGDILIWSAAGNINAGRGSKTTIDYTPVQRLYDSFGNVFLSPSVPSSGAGIGTLNPIPQIPAGDINLVAPFGTVDAGEAGIRASGNVNIAALHVVNGSNISFGGSAAGVPVAPAINVSALTTASNTAGAATQSTAPTANQGGLPTIWIVEVLGYGGGDTQPAPRKGKENTEAMNQVRQASASF